MKLTQTIVKEFSVSDMKKVLSSKKLGYHMRDKKEFYLDMLSKILKKYRWEILKTYMGYQIILNGYRCFTQIKLVDGGGGILTSDEVFQRIQSLDDEVGIDL